MSENIDLQHMIHESKQLLNPIYSNLDEYTTLTFAQSLDGKLSAEPNQPFILSGKASLVMTHRLREIHDGILIGIGTCLSDNPKLTARFIEIPSDDKHPIPVIIDSKLKIDLHCFVLTQHPKKPIIITTENCDQDKLTKLKEMGIQIVISPVNDQGQVNLRHSIDQLKQLGIRKLMVEGGAEVIQSFLNTPGSFSQLIITIAPKLVGNLGCSISSKLNSIQDAKIAFDNVKYSQLGDDCIMVAKPRWN